MLSLYIAHINYRDEDVSYEVVKPVTDNTFLDNLFKRENQVLKSYLFGKDLGESSTLLSSSDLQLDEEIVSGVSIESFFQLPEAVQINIIEELDQDSDYVGTSSIFIQKSDTNNSPLIKAFEAYNDAKLELNLLLNND